MDRVWQDGLKTQSRDGFLRETHKDAMSHKNRKPTRSLLNFDSLEHRNLLSVLINAKPTLNVEINPPHVTQHHRGVYILQPTIIHVTGSAQPPAANDTVRVDFYAEDAQGNLVNGGNPVGTATPDFLGLYKADITLPSTIRKDVNFLVARETAIGTIGSDLVINPTTLSGLTGTLGINGTTASGLIGTVADPGSVSTIAATQGGFTGTVSNPATTSTLNATLISIPPGLIMGTVANPASTSLLAGTAGAISGTSTNPAVTSGFTQTGTSAIAGTTGSFTQTGTAAIAGTTGTATMNINEAAVSDPVTIYIHQPRGPQPLIGSTGLHAHKTHALQVHGTHVHRFA